MFGLVEWRGAGERCGAREKCLGGVRFLAVGIRRGDGLRAVWSLRTAARTLERYGVTQAVFPRGFSAYERFAARGIVPVDVRPLREAAAAAIARRVMAQQEIAPRRATIALCALRVTRAYAAAAETLADGTYTIAVTLEGGSGKANIQSPCTLTVADGKMTATIVWSSSHYDYMLVDGERCDVLSTENGSTFEIPVAALDTPLAVVGDTTAMSTPHEIDYTLTFDASSAEVNG